MCQKLRNNFWHIKKNYIQAKFIRPVRLELRSTPRKGQKLLAQGNALGYYACKLVAL